MNIRMIGYMDAADSGNKVSIIYFINYDTK